MDTWTAEQVDVSEPRSNPCLRKNGRDPETDH